MIDFSINMQENARLGGTVVYALPQVRTVLTIDDFADHIATHGAAYDRGDIAAILYKVVSCLKEQVLAGNQVELGDLGSFGPALSSTGYMKKGGKPEEFTADAVKVVTIRWKKGAGIKNMREMAQLNHVVGRKEQADGVKNVRASLVQSTAGQGNVGA